MCLVTEEPEAYAVNQAILLLTKKYFEWRTAVPRRHRDCLGSSSHVCIYEVFVTTYERLQVAELSLTPPLLFEPPPPPPPPQIAGLALGLKDESS